MPPIQNPTIFSQRALVVEPDEAVRQRISELLEEHGLEVSACGDVAIGRELFEDQRLVVAPLNGDNAAMKEFVAWVRAEAGISQPWIIAMGVQHELAPGETPAHYGVNDLLTGPVDTRSLTRRLESLGWDRREARKVEPRALLESAGTTAELTVTNARPAVPASAFPVPPSYHRAPAQARVLTVMENGSFSVLMHQFPAAVAVLDRQLNYLSVNSRWVSEFQIPATSLAGRSHYEVFPDLHPDWRGMYEKCLAGNSPLSSEDVLIRPDGSEGMVRWDIQPWQETSGGLGGLVLICTAASIPAADEGPAGRGVPSPEGNPLPDPAASPVSADRISGEGKLAISDNKHAVEDPFLEMAEAAPFGMVLLDEDAHVVYANPQHGMVLGFSAAPGTPIQQWLERACAGDEVFQKRALEDWWENIWRRRTPLTCSMRNAGGLVKDIEFRPAALSGDRILLTIFDVTDARLDEQAIRASEARYRGLFQQSSAALLIINPAGNITEVNAAFENLTGIPRHDARRAQLREFLPPPALQRLQQQASHGGDPGGGFQSTLLHRTGTSTAVHISTAIIRNDQGQPAFTACLFAPLSPAPMGSAWGEITPDWLFVLDADGTIIDHTASRDFGAWQPPEAASLKDGWLENAVPDLVAPLPLDVMMERILDSPGHETRCAYSLTFPGETAPRQVEARLILLPGGPPSRFGLNLRDVTKARTAPSGKGFNTALLEHLTTAAILTDERGRILHLNPAAGALTGFAAGELEGSGLYQLFRPDAPSAFSEELSSQLQARRSWQAITKFTGKDGTHAPCGVELTPAFDESTGFMGFILLLRPGASAAPEDLPYREECADGRDLPSPSISLHRACNDLQILTSLMALQMEHSPDGAARAALQSSRGRLAAVAVIYRLLQEGQGQVDLARFIQETGRTLLQTRGSHGGTITIEPLFSGIKLPQRPALAFGLVVEELLASCLTFSFPGPHDEGHIRLTLTVEGETALLIIRDNGQTLSGERLAERQTTFSSEVIHLLTSQIGGEMSFLPEFDNQVMLRFRIPRQQD